MLVVCGSAMHGLESFASAASRRLRSCWLVGEPSCGHASKHRTAQLAAAAPGRNHDNRITPAFACQGMVATLVITLPSTYEVSWSARNKLVSSDARLLLCQADGASWARPMLLMAAAWRQRLIPASAL